MNETSDTLQVLTVLSTCFLFEFFAHGGRVGTVIDKIGGLNIRSSDYLFIKREESRETSTHHPVCSHPPLGSSWEVKEWHRIMLLSVTIKNGREKKRDNLNKPNSGGIRDDESNSEEILPGMVSRVVPGSGHTGGEEMKPHS